MDDVAGVVTPKKPAPPVRARKLPLGSVSRSSQSSVAEGLEAIKAELTRRMDDPQLEARDLPALSREYRLLVSAIEDRGGVAKGDGLDELAARRKSRRSG